MHSPRSRWRSLLVRSGKTRARVAITGFSIAASLLLTASVMLFVGAPPVEWILWLLPATVVPLVVAPMASHLVLELAFELEGTQAQVLQQEAQLRALFEHAPIGIARLDAHGRVRHANPLMRKLLGAHAHGPLPEWDAVFSQPEQLHAFRVALNDGAPLDSTRWQWVDQHANMRTVRVAMVPMPADISASPESDCVLLADDVTEREAVEAQLLRAQKLDLIGRLAGGLAHDFNNLLTVVRASVASLGGAETAPELSAIDDAAVRGARLTRRLLSISRQDLLMRTPQRMAPLLDETLELMRRVLPDRVHVDVPNDVPDVTIALDADAVQQALLNLVVNARDAIEHDGTITLRAVEAEHERARMLVVTVEDTGTGMAETVLARATEPFFSTKPADAGSGLGLAMVQGTMRRHEGRLVLASTPGAGTRAELWFPIVAAPQPAADASTVRPSQPTASTHAGAGHVMISAVTDTPAKAAPLAHLLLVEDERAVRLATERALQRLGYAVTSTSSMASALTCIASGTPVDLVVTDVMMPGGTGVELLQAVRTSGGTTPFLLVSGYAMDNLDAVLATDARTALLGKPWTLERLAEQVRAMLPDQRAVAP